MPARKSAFLATGTYATMLFTGSLPLKAVVSARGLSAARVKGPGDGSDVNVSHDGVLAVLLWPIDAPEAFPISTDGARGGRWHAGMQLSGPVYRHSGR